MKQKNNKGKMSRKRNIARHTERSLIERGGGIEKTPIHAVVSPVEVVTDAVQSQGKAKRVEVQKEGRNGRHRETP